MNMDKKHHPLDDLFRQGLNDLEITPTEAGRSGFMKKAGRELGKKAQRAGWLPVISIILGIGILAGTSLIIYHSTENKIIDNSSVAGLNNLKGQSAVPGSGNSTAASGTSSQSTAGTSHKQITPPQSAQSNFITAQKNQIKEKKHMTVTEDKVAPAVASSNLIINSTPITSDASETNQAQENNPVNITENDAKEPIKAISFDSLSKEPAVTRDSIARTPGDIPKEGSDHHSSASFHNREWNICAGIYYTPEWIFNTLDNNKYVNNFGLEGQFRYGPYSVRTGIGLSITRGYNEIVVETKPYLGSYQALDHITYQWDSRHYHLVPTYYTTLKEVFDTALHENYFTLEKEYTYMQVPLILGYDFFHEKWFSLGARVGPVLSILLKTKELTAQYDAGKDEVISINNVTPDRIHLNWQAMAGVNASFRLSELFIFELEPQVRYYFNSVYEKSSPSTKPWSVGIRGAFLVKF
jgi:hypothetical protein